MTGRIEKLQREYNLTVRWRVFPLHPETPEEGQLLTDLFSASPEKIAAMMENLNQTARELGIPFGPRKKTYNSRLAQELGLWAEDKGKGDSFHKIAFRAYFSDGLNLAQKSVLMQIVRDANLPDEEASQILTDRSYAARVDEDWADSRVRGVTAVPTFLMGTHKLVGAQSYESLAELITLYNVSRR